MEDNSKPIITLIGGYHKNRMTDQGTKTLEAIIAVTVWKYRKRYRTTRIKLDTNAAPVV